MSGSVNKVILVGNLGADPDIRPLAGGQSVANLRIATSENWSDKVTGERRERTEWHNVSVFSPNAVNYAQSYLKKGSPVYIEGRLQTRKWQDPSGQDRYSTEIVVNNIGGQLIGLPSNQTSLETGPLPQTTPNTQPGFDPGDIPF